MTIALTIIQVIICLVLIAAVTLQSGKSSGLGVLSGGGNDNFLAKNKSKTLDGRLASITKWLAVAFAVITLVLNIII